MWLNTTWNFKTLHTIVHTVIRRESCLKNIEKSPSGWLFYFSALKHPEFVTVDTKQGVVRKVNMIQDNRNIVQTQKDFSVFKSHFNKVCQTYKCTETIQKIKHLKHFNWKTMLSQKNCWIATAQVNYYVLTENSTWKQNRTVNVSIMCQ